MTQADDLICAFERAAADARRAEEAYRKRAARRIEELARERTTAYRRLNLIRAIANAVSGSTDAKKAAKAARAAVRRELDWDSETPRRKEVLDRLQPVFTFLAMGEIPESSGEDGTPESAALTELRAFEDWYRSETGSDFYALFDRYMPETPRVDF